jgi:hypothetical protein
MQLTYFAGSSNVYTHDGIFWPMKQEFDAILAPGIHDMTIDQFRSTFVDAFQNNQRRAKIMSRFFDFLTTLFSLDVAAEIWLDGSFLTRKESPNDIDIVVFLDEKRVARLDATGQSRLRYLGGNPAATKVRFMTDVRMAPTSNGDLRSYWRGWFGFDRSENAKGFVRLIAGNL